jgi:hypothetical protein
VIPGLDPIYVDPVLPLPPVDISEATDVSLSTFLGVVQSLLDVVADLVLTGDDSLVQPLPAMEMSPNLGPMEKRDIADDAAFPNGATARQINPLTTFVWSLLNSVTNVVSKTPLGGLLPLKDLTSAVTGLVDTVTNTPLLSAVTNSQPVTDLLNNLTSSIAAPEGLLDGLTNAGSGDLLGGLLGGLLGRDLGDSIGQALYTRQTTPNLASLLGSFAPPSTPTTKPVTNVIGSLLNSATSAVPSLLSPVASAVPNLLGSLGLSPSDNPTTGSVSIPANLAILTPLLDPLAGLLGPLADPLAGLLDPLTSLVEPLTSMIEPLLDPVKELLGSLGDGDFDLNDLDLGALGDLGLGDIGNVEDVVGGLFGTLTGALPLSGLPALGPLLGAVLGPVGALFLNPAILTPLIAPISGLLSGLSGLGGLGGLVPRSESDALAQLLASLSSSPGLVDELARLELNKRKDSVMESPEASNLSNMEQFMVHMQEFLQIMSDTSIPSEEKINMVMPLLQGVSLEGSVPKRMMRRGARMSQDEGVMPVMDA